MWNIYTLYVLLRERNPSRVWMGCLELILPGAGSGAPQKDSRQGRTEGTGAQAGSRVQPPAFPDSLAPWTGAGRFGAFPSACGPSGSLGPRDSETLTRPGFQRPLSARRSHDPQAEKP